MERDRRDATVSGEPPGTGTETAGLRCYAPCVVLGSLVAVLLTAPGAQARGAPSHLPAPTSNLAADEELRLFPALAYPDAGGWEVHIRAWVYEPELHSWWRSWALRALRRALGLPLESEENTTFIRRARPFLADNERGKRIVVEIAGAPYTLPPTAADGHRQARLRLAREALEGAPTEARARLRPGDPRSFSAPILRLDPGGLSVISDIDDTLRVSEVREVEALLANTFLRPFVAVPGIAATFRAWADQGAAFHYVSASPWQLYDPLRRFFADVALPEGSFHLKAFRWTDRSFLSLFQDPREYKLRTIEPLLGAAPQRRAVLVGDSGEADPEAYAELYRRHPEQVLHIFIRDVSAEGPQAARYRTTFDGVPAERWTVFREASALPQRLVDASPRSADGPRRALSR